MKEKVSPIFINFSKQTVAIWVATSNDPLEFTVVEENIPFAEIERRILNREMEPLVAFPISQGQRMRSYWENETQSNNDVPREPGG